MDACSSIAIVSAKEGTYVYSQPSSNSETMEHLTFNKQVILCDRHGDWVGVVYHDNIYECEVFTPIANRQKYDGHCTSGWIEAKNIEIIAG
ncbi:hypothetical protein VIBNISFn118_1270005 [Vibrio nigripulchritudo SFn118]|nr:hypothetical protein VIBNISFn118_1270005 [Vibrio nigripulchritudo SFn118]